MGTPYAMDSQSNLGISAKEIGPKSPGAFIFQIGNFLGYEERKKSGTSKMEIEFEMHEWKLEEVEGYRTKG
jgi:hypothetical protein